MFGEYETKKVRDILCGSFERVLASVLHRPISESTTVHYSSGTLVGVFGFLLVLSYLLAKLIPGKKAMSGFLYFTGWSLTAYIFRWVTNDLALFLPYIACYCAIAGLVSFAVTYYYGPITNPRAQDIICWSLRVLSFCGVYYSVQLETVGFAIILLLLSYRFIPVKMKIPGVAYIRMKWYTRYPPKRRLLTLEEYETQGQIETAKALEELREYCTKAESHPWKLVMKLSKPDRMASFVEGDSHVTIAEKSMHDELLVTSAIYSSDEEEGNRDNSCRDNYDSDEELAAVTQHPQSSEANNNESVPPSPEASKRNGFQTG